MTTKLTLSIDKEVIEQAKTVSRRRGKSLSRIIEDHLRAMAADEAKLPSGVRAMSGALKGKVNADLNIKAAKGVYLKKKYGL
jgi:aromatic ring-opening dioxygenase LigB subunit